MRCKEVHALLPRTGALSSTFDSKIFWRGSKTHFLLPRDLLLTPKLDPLSILKLLLAPVGSSLNQSSRHGSTQRARIVHATWDFHGMPPGSARMLPGDVFFYYYAKFFASPRLQTSPLAPGRALEIRPTANVMRTVPVSKLNQLRREGRKLVPMLLTGLPVGRTTLKITIKINILRVPDRK